MMDRQEKAQESFETAKGSFQDGFRELANGFRALLGMKRVGYIDIAKPARSEWGKYIERKELEDLD
ncbi:MAG: hypothetical protein F6J93_37765 [Oscillatoria sp. SIO1A7]|nr:hypothetical protein [Oscillatoria sp. SIO1A7]